MGLPLYYKRLIEPLFPGAISKKKPRITTLAIDFAGIAHQIVGHLNRIQPDWNLTEYFTYMTDMLLNIVHEFNPQRLILCMDGTAPLGKINQGRKRRFRHADEKRKVTEHFDTNAITPGTDFSFKLDEAIRNLLSTQRDKLPPNIIYSGHRVPGEGEHKIIDHIKELTDPTETIAIFGLDADLILLALPLKDHKIILYRENSWVNERNVERLLRLDPKMKRSVAENMSIQQEHNFLNISELRKLLTARNIGIPEFTLATFLLSNDFMPALPAFNLIGDLAEEFVKLLEDRKFADPFDIEEFQEFLKVLVPLQQSLLPKLAGKEKLKGQTEFYYLHYPTTIPTEDYKTFEKEWNRRLTYADVIPSNEEIETDNGIYDFPSYREDVTFHTERYLSILQWCYHYYLDHQSVNWEFVYFAEWAPSLSNLIKFSPSTEYKNLVKYINEPKQLESGLLGQLLLALPRNVKTGEPNDILPEELKIFQTPESPIFDFYPKRFKLIRDGVVQDSDGFVMLGQIDYPRFLETFEVKKLSIKRLARYQSDSVQRLERGTVSIEQITLKQKLLPLAKPIEISSTVDLFHRQIAELLGTPILQQVMGDQEERRFLSPVTIHSLPSPFEVKEVRRIPKLKSNAFL